MKKIWYLSERLSHGLALLHCFREAPFSKFSSVDNCSEFLLSFLPSFHVNVDAIHQIKA